MSSKYFCDICSKEIKTVLDCEHDNITYTHFCPICFSEFKSKVIDLINNMKNKHSNPEPKPEKPKKKSFFSILFS